jgi:hypothetical protein
LRRGVSAESRSPGIKFDADTSFLYGARAGVKVLSLAIELEYFQAAHNLFTSGVSVPAWNDRQVDYNHLGVNVRWIIRPPVIHPYLWPATVYPRTSRTSARTETAGSTSARAWS